MFKSFSLSFWCNFYVNFLKVAWAVQDRIIYLQYLQQIIIIWQGWELLIQCLSRNNIFWFTFKRHNILKLFHFMINILICWGCLHFDFLYWYGSLSLSLKFEEDPISGCRDTQLLIFWFGLLLDVVFISGIFDFCKVLLSSILKFEKDWSVVA